ncbi:diheme cytochrome c [Thiothrix lacustris]|uniref:Diheme cytochrome c n=2 Tax=Thiothrix lacustris TaxID=525917 RepID=A0ABY9MN81_9GAMM|nr:diheme cytochrome c [Thiothrix lacustris]WML89670.1 diheme cytochrome c [Thiothrix lacustris]
MLFNAKKSTLAITLAVLLLSSFGAMQAFGDDDEHEGREHGEGREGMTGGLLTASNATFQTECSACHMAYPPGMLPAASWREMMGTLDKHFGSDASLDEATVAEILPFLEQNAAPERKADSGEKPVLRITETSWFKHEHDEISAATWKRASIKSASNCMACHTSADKGNFDEDSVRIPR